MEVDLINLLNLSGGKAKIMYLILKDCSKIGNNNFTKDQLILMIGKIPQKSVLDGITKQINDKTDIKISFTVEGIKKKKYKFKINHKVNLKNTTKDKTEMKTKMKKSINIDVMEKSKNQLQQMKSKGQNIVNEEGYLKTIYDNEMKSITVSEEEKEIDKFLDNLKSEYDISDYESKKIPIISLRNEITHLPIYIDNEGFPSKAGQKLTLSQ